MIMTSRALSCAGQKGQRQVEQGESAVSYAPQLMYGPSKIIACLNRVLVMTIEV